MSMLIVGLVLTMLNTILASWDHAKMKRQEDSRGHFNPPYSTVHTVDTIHIQRFNAFFSLAYVVVVGWLVSWFVVVDDDDDDDDDDDGLRRSFFFQFGSKSNGENTIAPAMWKVDCRLIVDACANCAIVREENRKR